MSALKPVKSVVDAYCEHRIVRYNKYNSARLFVIAHTSRKRHNALVQTDPNHVLTSPSSHINDIAKYGKYEALTAKYKSRDAKTIAMAHELFREVFSLGPLHLGEYLSKLPIGTAHLHRTVF